MPASCAESTCRLSPWGESPFCFGHLMEHVSRSLPDVQRMQLHSRVDALLRTISFREQEALKLRHGLFGDGYDYTWEEIGRIFKCTVPTVRRYENRALEKLEHTWRFGGLLEFLDVHQFGAPQEQVVSAVHVCESELIKDLVKHPEHLRDVSPDAFEHIVAEIMAGLGFEVQLTPKTRDGGHDIVAVASDRLGLSTKYIVECKRYAPDRPIRVELVRSLYGVKQQQRADHAILATTSYFTRDAMKFCRSPEVWNLHPTDYDAIFEWLRVAAK